MKIYLLALVMVALQLSVVAQPNYGRLLVAEDIELIQLSNRAYVHVSTVEMPTFGKVSSNGLILVDGDEALLFDTPVTNEQTETLVAWVADSLHARVTKFVPNHWHADCMGGLDCLHSLGVQSYASQRTIDIAGEKGLPQPHHGFQDSLLLELHGIEVLCYYLGAGHALDNTVVWVPSERILFGGCMVKDIDSKGLGNLSDADVTEWRKTIDKVLSRFPSAHIVLPGHGPFGGMELVEHTRDLLKESAN